MTPYADTMHQRIEVGEFEPQFVAPTSLSGNALSKGSARSPFVEPIIVGEFWDDEIADDVPTLGSIEGGSGLLYLGTDHAFAGEAGGGKTYLLMHLVHDQVRTDPEALAIYLDYESNFKRFRMRCRQIGLTKDEAMRIGYIRPAGSIMNNCIYGTGWLTWAEEHLPNFVVIDSVAVSMNAAGLDENDNNSATAWWLGAIEPLNKLGITSSRIEHTGNEQMGKPMTRPRGASAKTDRVDGASYYCKTETHWSKTSSGSMLISSIKDRGGEYVKGTSVARMEVTVDALSENHEMEIHLVAVKATPRNSDGTVRLTGLMQKISRILAKGSMNATSLRTVVGGKTAFVTSSVETLLHEGYISVENGPRNSTTYTLVRSYIEADDPESDKYAGNGSKDLDVTDPFWDAPRG